MITSSVVPQSLIDQLHTLDARFEAREAMLRAERELLEEERERFQLAVAAKEWELQQQEHGLSLAQATWQASLSEATNIDAYQDERLLVIADGGEVATTLATLCGREPASGLAEAGRAACRRAKASAEDEAAAMAAAAALPAAITAKLTAAGFVPAALTSQSYKLYVDREAAATHRVIDWLRDGPSVLEGLPRPILQQLVLEADHWQMPLLIAQLNERLGQPDAAGEGLSSLEWTLSELHKHPKRTALCRAALEELRSWLSASRERRRLALRRGEEVLSTAMGGDWPLRGQRRPRATEREELPFPRVRPKLLEGMQ
jgi:hypothetical protein